MTPSKPNLKSLQKELQDFIIEIPFDSISTIERSENSDLIAQLKAHIDKGYGLNCQGMSLLLRQRVQELGFAKNETKLVSVMPEPSLDESLAKHVGLSVQLDEDEFLLEPSLLVPQPIKIPAIGVSTSFDFPFGRIRNGKLIYRSCELTRLNDHQLKIIISLVDRDEEYSIEVINMTYNLKSSLSEAKTFQRIFNNKEKHIVLTRSYLSTLISEESESEVILTNLFAILRQNNGYSQRDYQSLQSFCKKNGYEFEKLIAFL